MAGDEGERLRRIVSQICSERGHTPSDGRISTRGPAFGERVDHLAAANLGSDDENFVAAMRQALTDLADAVGAASLGSERQRIVAAALDGAELVIRGQLALGSPEQLRTLLPSFVFLVALPIVDQDEALALSRRAEELVDQRLDT